MRTTHHVLFVGLSLVALASAATAQGQRWLRQFGTPSEGKAIGVAPDGSRGSYACGTTRGSLGVPAMGAEDVWIARRDGVGHLLWTRLLGTPGFDIATSAAPDGAGGVYVAGVKLGRMAGSSTGAQGDAWLAHVDSAGTR